jgi:4-hydroxy-3-methylbut-2-enyl diphosphate reductase
MVDYSPRPDLILILGSANSSNTKKLLQIAQDGDIESLRIDTIKEIKESLFEDRKVVGLSSGASVPESVIEEAVDFFKGLGVSADAISDFKLVNEKIKL